MKNKEAPSVSRKIRRGGAAPYGEAITLAKTEDEKKLIYEKYVKGVPEEIVSKLSDEHVLRTAALSLVASGFIRTKQTLREFFEKTFYGYQYKSDWGFKMRIDSAIETLKNYGFIQEVGDKLEPTKIGKRVSELYIDPDTAFKIVEGLKVFTDDASDFSLLHLIAYTPEMFPGLSVRRSDLEWIEEELVEWESQLLTHIPKDWDLERDSFLRAFKLALLLKDWISERSEQNILEKFNVRPGELRSRVASAEWLLYGCSEITRLMAKMNCISEVNRIRFRMKYGIKEELLPLVKLKGVGRFRARRLYSAGIKNIRDLKRADVGKVKLLIGEKTAENVLAQVS